MAQFCSEYLVSKSWMVPSIRRSEDALGLRHVYLLESFDNRDPLLVCHWSNYSAYLTNSAEFHSLWRLPAPLSIYSHHSIPIKRNWSILALLRKSVQPIVLALASLLVAFEVIFGRYSELLIRVPIEVSKNEEEPNQFYVGERISLPVIVSSGSKEADRKVSVEASNVSEYTFQNGVKTESVIHNLSTQEISTTLWKENETKTLYIKGDPAAVYDASELPKSRYSAEIELQSKGCYFCRFVKSKPISLDYEVWNPMTIVFIAPDGCERKSVCIVEAQIFIAQELNNGIKVSHLFAQDDNVVLVDVYSDKEHTFNSWGEPPVRAIWSIDEKISNFSETNAFLRLESKDNHLFSTQQWNEATHRLRKQISLHVATKI